jgi:hypothetical protein
MPSSYGYQRAASSTVYTDPTKPPPSSETCPPGQVLVLGECYPEPGTAEEIDSPPDQAPGTIPSGTFSAVYQPPPPTQEPVDQPFPWLVLALGLAGVYLWKKS